MLNNVSQIAASRTRKTNIHFIANFYENLMERDEFDATLLYLNQF